MAWRIADGHLMRFTATAVVAVMAFAPIVAAEHEPCGKPATLYIDAHTLMFEMSMDEYVTLYLTSSGYSAVQMTFAGTSAPHEVVSAINSFTECCHGLKASHDGGWADPLRIESVSGGWSAHATVAQAGCESPPLLMSEPSGEPAHFVTAHGSEAALGDLNCDGIVGAADLLTLLQHWGPCPYPHAPCPADLSLDGNVGVDDLLILLAIWGPQ